MNTNKHKHLMNTGKHMYLTLGQAAKEAKKSKATISKYIKNGKLSVVEKGKDGFKIDPSELFRVFPLSEQQTVDNEQSQTLANSNILNESSSIKTLLEELQNDKEDYKRRLDNAEERITKLTETISQQTLLIADMRSASQKAAEQKEEATRRKGFWGWLVG